MTKTKFDCVKCIFKANCFYDKLDAKDKKKWNLLKKIHACSDRDLVFEEGKTPSGIYTVCKGRVKIYMRDMYNQQMIIWIKHPGDMFGQISIFSGEEYLANAECMGNTVISRISLKDWNSFLNETTYRELLKQLSIEMRKIFYKLKDTAYLPAKNKVALTLLNYISYKTKNTLNPTIYGLKRIEIAEITGLALETVVRTLAIFEKKKIIKRDGRAIKILDIEKINKLANIQQI